MLARACEEWKWIFLVDLLLCTMCTVMNNRPNENQFKGAYPMDNNLLYIFCNVNDFT